MASIDEYKKFIASAPQAQREFRTIEIYHPDFDELLRFVQDFTDNSFTLESTAPRNPSESVLFTALAANIIEPAEEGGIDSILTVDLGAVGNEVNNQIDQITPDGSLIAIEVIYRKYYSGDLTTPVLVLNLSASEIGFDGYTSVGFTAEDTNITTKRAGELYTLERFPTLANI
jgi:hypothetical protein